MSKLAKFLQKALKIAPEEILSSKPNPRQIGQTKFFEDYSTFYSLLKADALVEMMVSAKALIEEEANRRPAPPQTDRLRIAAQTLRPIPTREFVQRLISKGVAQPEDFVGACILLHRFWYALPSAFAGPSPGQIDALILASILLSTKSLAALNALYDNNAYAICAKCETKLLNALELQLLLAMEFNVTLHLKDYVPLRCIINSELVFSSSDQQTTPITTPITATNTTSFLLSHQPIPSSPSLSNHPSPVFLPMLSLPSSSNGSPASVLILPPPRPSLPPLSQNHHPRSQSRRKQVSFAESDGASQEFSLVPILTPIIKQEVINLFFEISSV